MFCSCGQYGGKFRARKNFLQLFFNLDLARRLLGASTIHANAELARRLLGVALRKCLRRSNLRRGAGLGGVPPFGYVLSIGLS